MKEASQYENRLTPLTLCKCFEFEERSLIMKTAKLATKKDIPNIMS